MDNRVLSRTTDNMYDEDLEYGELTDQKDIKKMKYMAFHDELTGLPNRRMLGSCLDEHILNAKQKQTKLAILFIDINHFKLINDRYGHLIGDQFLVEVGKRFTSLSFEENLIFRKSGDEFIIILPDTENLEEKIHSITTLFNDRFRLGTCEFHASISIGISMYPDHGKDQDTLMEYADIAMFESKKYFGCTYRIYQPTMSNAHEEQLILKTFLQKAIELNQMELYYQSTYNIQTKEIVRVESFIHWNNPELDYLTPKQVITFADDYELTVMLFERVFLNVCTQIKLWKEEFNFSFRISIKIPSFLLTETLFLNKIQQILRETGANPHQLELEIQNIEMINNLVELTDAIIRLKVSGISIVINTLRIDYAFLTFIKNTQIDAIKMDQSVVQKLTYEGSDEGIVAAMIQLAHALSLQVIADGVDREEEFQLLKKHSCDFVQGFYFSKPLSSESFTKTAFERITCSNILG